MKDKCEFCGGLPVAFPSASTCTNCWEVAGRLVKFLKSAKGERFTRNLLAEKEKESE